MPTYLNAILDAHRRASTRDVRDLGTLETRAMRSPPCRSFEQALGEPGLSVIAEIKRRSPSKGELALDLDPSEVATEYEAGGARAISVLTDSEFFGALDRDLASARKAVSVPVLRKDFTVSLRDVYDTKIMGADAVLLIVAALSDEELQTFLDAARRVGLDALVEVHDETELDRALGVGATIIGVNQRDLRTFEVDRTRAMRVRSSIPQGCLAVAESGIRDEGDAKRLADAGFDAILVGESTVTASDHGEAVRRLARYEVAHRGDDAHVAR